MFHCAVLTLLAIVLFPEGRDAYSGGAPDTACQLMFPSGHGVDAQVSASPVTFNMTEGSKFKTGDYIPVTLRTTDAEGFGGFFIQARLASNNSLIAGMIFSEGLPSTMKTLNCLGIAQSAVTHSSKDQKKFVTVYWHAAGVKENVLFRATVVREKTKFWVNVASSPLTYSTNTSSFSPNKPAYPSGSATRTSGTLSLLAVFVTVFLVLFK